MYRSFFGLDDRPFDLTPNPRFLVLTDQHREALSNLEYGIAGRRGITLLLGEAGTGKTTLIRTALDRQDEHVHTVHLSNPALSRAEFVEMLAARFELSPDARTSKTALLLELERLMRDRHARGESSVLIIDEAQSIPDDLLEEIRLMANIETDEAKLLSVVLAGQPELADRLNHRDLRQLKQRIALRCELKPLSPTETLGYVAGRVAAAGGVGARVFTREAVALVHERSGGVPRLISVIADNALLSAFAVGQRPVSRAIVEEVCRDLDLPAQPAGEPPAEAGPRTGTQARQPAPPARSLLVFDDGRPGPEAEDRRGRPPDRRGRPLDRRGRLQPAQGQPAQGQPAREGRPPDRRGRPLDRRGRLQPAQGQPAQSDVTRPKEARIFSTLYPKPRRWPFFNFLRQE